jgi:hypothetical protein
MKRTLLTLVLTFALLALLYAGGSFLWQATGIRVTVTNVGSDPLRDAAVITPGERASPLGELQPGMVKSVLVWPRGTGQIELRFQNGLEQPTSLILDGYVESGYAGTIDVHVKDGLIVRQENRVNVTLLTRTHEGISPCHARCHSMPLKAPSASWWRAWSRGRTRFDLAGQANRHCHPSTAKALALSAGLGEGHEALDGPRL